MLPNFRYLYNSYSVNEEKYLKHVKVLEASVANLEFNIFRHNKPEEQGCRCRCFMMDL